LRLKENLEEKGCFVVYFAADEGDIDPEDTQYTDILIACTRNLLKYFEQINSTPLQNWLKARWQDLIDLALTEIKLEDAKLETGDLIKYFGKLSAAIRAVPSERHEIRKKLNPHTITLLTALNEFIAEGKKSLADSSKLVVIVDNLDRIVPVNRGENKTNHDEIFLDRGAQLRGLNCHLVYTIPISMAYSNRATDLRDFYDNDPMVLPMIMVTNLDGSRNEQGIARIKDIIDKRIRQFTPFKNPGTEVFESVEVLDKLCLMTGGHVRNLILLRISLLLPKRCKGRLLNREMSIDGRYSMSSGRFWRGFILVMIFKMMNPIVSYCLIAVFCNMAFLMGIGNYKVGMMCIR